MPDNPQDEDDIIYSHFKDASDDVVKETARLAELYVSQQLATITAQSQRAATLAGIFGTGAVLLASISLSSKLEELAPAGALTIGLIGSVGMLLAALICAQAAKSTDIIFSGNQPLNWLGNRSIRDKHLALAGELSNYQLSIEFNRAIAYSNGRKLKWGLRLGSWVPAAVVSAVIFVSVFNIKEVWAFCVRLLRQFSEIFG